jgi:hypothetical protein
MPHIALTPESYAAPNLRAAVFVAKSLTVSQKNAVRHVIDALTVNAGTNNQRGWEFISRVLL